MSGRGTDETVRRIYDVARTHDFDRNANGHEMSGTLIVAACLSVYVTIVLFDWRTLEGSRQFAGPLHAGSCGNLISGTMSGPRGRLGGLS